MEAARVEGAGGPGRGSPEESRGAGLLRTSRLPSRPGTSARPSARSPLHCGWPHRAGVRGGTGRYCTVSSRNRWAREGARSPRPRPSGAASALSSWLRLSLSPQMCFQPPASLRGPRAQPAPHTSGGGGGAAHARNQRERVPHEWGPAWAFCRRPWGRAPHTQGLRQTSGFPSVVRVLLFGSLFGYFSRRGGGGEGSHAGLAPVLSPRPVGPPPLLQHMCTTCKVSPPSRKKKTRAPPGQ